MAFDRDLNVAFARALEATGRPRLEGWEMLGATGVRGLRLAHETDLLETLLITEREEEAVAVIERNVEELHLPRVHVHPADARTPPPEGPFDYVDLDPYGSPLPYLNAMFRSVRLPAIVAVTATDLMVLAGIVRGACEARYGARPLHGRLAPEGGLRILLATLAKEARRHRATLTPLLSYVHDHHVRTYAELVPSEGARTTDPVAPIDPATWTGPVLGPKGPYGPFWVGPLFDRRVVEHLAVPPSPARPKEIQSWIERFRAEAEVDQPFFYEPNQIARALHLTQPPPLEALLAGLRASGAKATRAHPQASALRTDAPRSVVESVARSLGTRA
jgi:tRNA (guanine26-N2/guanine27-N2)-dimethyltransferase